MEKTKLLSIAVIGLLVLNLGLLAFLWLGGKQGDRPPQGGGPRAQTKALEFLMNELSFDAAQRTACGQFIQDHRRRMDSLQNVNRQNQDRLYDNLKTGDSSMAQNMGDVQTQIQLEVFNYFRNIRALCRDDQKALFDRVIYDAMRMMKPPQPPEPK